MEITLEQAEKVAERIEAANKVTEELLIRQEKLRVQQILGGQSSAGSAPMSDAEKTKLDMQKYFKGTALEKVLQ
jgi:hypothetical protein